MEIIAYSFRINLLLLSASQDTTIVDPGNTTPSKVMATFQTIGIITKPNAPNILEGVKPIHDWLIAHHKTVLIDSPPGSPSPDSVTRLQIAKEADLLIVLGGDGTMLSGARLVEQREIPILGVNMGGLGFLTEINFDDLPTALDKVFAGKFQLDKRLMLKIQLQRGDHILGNYSALNDLVISKGHLARMIATKIWVNHAFMTNLRGDGLIIATPTGSTAYSLSAKGPILDPRLEVLLINPICPHTFSHRPFLAPGDVLITVELTSQEPAMATIDGQVGTEMLRGDLVHVRASDHRTQLIRFPDRSYFEVLRTKLRWGDG
ncbi:MAG: NAD(+)/NADH kinase [Nitrospirota bacterium]|nr:NAD(+)/NADH kinase [Nitrospirota bacterium]MDH5295892.1 NAD(+)/NADH kinase [Nitrospirota bacterium]